jgi:hypothetical protein
MNLIGKRHLGDDVVPEPVDAALFRQHVDGGWIDPRIDQAPHQRHGDRQVGIVVGVHQGGGGQHRHRRLADRHNMRLAAERMQDGDDVIDVIVEAEHAFRQRHHARIAPFGDVDIVIGQERFDRAAQERGVMARQRRNDEKSGLLPAWRPLEYPLEMQQPAERSLPNAFDAHRHAFAADQC